VEEISFQPQFPLSVECLEMYCCHDGSGGCRGGGGGVDDSSELVPQLSVPVMALRIPVG
jgi:hypothetical protein